MPYVSTRKRKRSRVSYRPKRFTKYKTTSKYLTAKKATMSRKSTYKRRKFTVKKRKTLKKEAKENKTPQLIPVGQSQFLLKHQFRKPKFGVNNKYGWKYIMEGVGTFVTCDTGEQQLIVGSPMLTIPQMTTASAVSPSFFDVLPWDLNPYARSSGSDAFPGNMDPAAPPIAVGQVSQYEDRLYLSRVTGFMDLLNDTAHGIAYVDVYWLLAKHDYARDPATSFVNSIVNDSFSNTGPIAPKQTGQLSSSQFQTVGGELPGSAFAVNYGLKPFQFPNFGKFWKCFHKNSFVLQPGEQKRTYINFAFNKVLMKSEPQNIKDANGNALTWAHNTVYPFIVFRGGLVLTHTGALGTGTKRVSYNKVQLVYNDYYKYHFHSMPRDEEKASFTRIAPWYTAIAGTEYEDFVDAEEHVDEVSGLGVVTQRDVEFPQ